MVVRHDAFDRLFPSSHLLGIWHLLPRGMPEFFEKAAIFGDQTKILRGTLGTKSGSSPKSLVRPDRGLGLVLAGSGAGCSGTPRS